MNEADFLGNIASRLGRSTPLMEAPMRNMVGVPPAWRSNRALRTELIQMFMASMQRQGGSASCYLSKKDLQGALTASLQELQPQVVAVSSTALLTKSELEETLRIYQPIWCDAAEEHTSKQERSRRMAELAVADVAVTGSYCAIAETGTLVLAHRPDQPRSLSLLPTVHIVLVDAKQIYTYLGEALRSFSREHNLPANVLCMSGPSRSSDIENDLTIGVHGPAAVIALVLDEQ